MFFNEQNDQSLITSNTGKCFSSLRNMPIDAQDEMVKADYLLLTIQSGKNTPEEIQEFKKQRLKHLDNIANALDQ